MTFPCRLCRADAAEVLVDFGKQPIGSRFLRTPDESEELFPLVLAQCGVCGLAQLRDAIPAVELKPRFDWIAYNEPEAHLDDVADAIARLPGIAKNSTAWGISSKDDSLLERLSRRGFSETYRLDPLRDLGLSAPAGVEQVQTAIRAEAVEAALAGRQRPQVVVARHIAEHAEDVHAFLGALRRLAAPGGYLVIEVPDCTAAFSRSDVAVLWEEHVLYFTPVTLQRLLATAGLKQHYVRSFPNSLEGALVAIGRVAEPDELPGSAEARDQRALLREFVQGLAPRRERIARFVAEFGQSGRVALLGAGHLGGTFINLAGLQDKIELVIDDNSHKQGLYMPGSRLPIVGSAALRQRDIQLCLLAVQPAAAQAIADKNADWTREGGKFASIFAGTPLSFFS
jgi:hypothetical protein